MTILSPARSFPSTRTNLSSSIRPAILVAAAVVACSASGAMADIVGFGDYSTNWNWQRIDAAQSFSPSGNGIRITQADGGVQWRNYLHTIRQNVTQFSASFTFTAGQSTLPSNTSSFASGLSLVLLTTPLATNGTTLSGGTPFDYGYQTPGSNFSPYNLMNPSVALVLATPLSGSTGSAAGVYTNGQTGGAPSPTGNVNLVVNQPINVSVRYNQSGDLPNFMYFTLTNQITGATYAPAPTFINIPTTLGGANTAYVGFTTLSRGSDQTITNFSFAAVPSPSVAALLGLGGLMAARRRR